MDIYFDFEATQFSERVIAIGASCEYGDFDCLVSLFKRDKLTPFITQFTGITKEMLIGAQSAEQAFSNLYNWICEVSAEADTPIFYHCYGDSDSSFLINTANKMEESGVRTFVVNLAKSLIDDSYQVRKFFHAKSIGLHKAIEYFEPDVSEQTHDPLDDAILLHRLMQHLDNAEVLEVCPFKECTDISNKTRADNKIGTNNKTKDHIDSKRYIIILTHAFDATAKPRKFITCTDAVDWAYQKILKKFPNVPISTIQKNALKAIKNDGNYMGWNWHKQYI